MSRLPEIANPHQRLICVCPNRFQSTSITDAPKQL